MLDRTTVASGSSAGKVLVVRVVFERRGGQKVSGEWLYLLFGNQFLIGREEGCEIRIIDERISRKHCLIRLGEENASLTDLGSTNGTFRNGELVEDEIIIENRDKLNLGEAVVYKVRTCRRSGKLSSVRLHNGGEVYLLASNEILLGRFQESGDEVDLMIYDESVQPKHCRIEHFYNDNFIVALSPEAPLFVNGNPVKELGLKDGDLVELGGTAFRWKIISMT
jgi:pSer/pThr/pTyr-binding forkhead associated (FHA) protein